MAGRPVFFYSCRTSAAEIKLIHHRHLVVEEPASPQSRFSSKAGLARRHNFFSIRDAEEKLNSDLGTPAISARQKYSSVGQKYS